MPSIRPGRISGTAGIEDGLSRFPELRQLVLARLDPLPGPVRKLLDAASVLGEHVDPPVLAELTGAGADEVAALLDQAVAQGVLLSAPDSAGLSFRHALRAVGHGGSPVGDRVPGLRRGRAVRRARAACRRRG